MACSYAYLSGRFTHDFAASRAKVMLNRHTSLLDRSDAINDDDVSVAGDSMISVIQYSENKGGNRMYGKKQVVQWDPSTTMFRTRTMLDIKDVKKKSSRRTPLKFLTRVLYNNFIPSGNITDDYFTYSKWRHASAS